MAKPTDITRGPQLLFEIDEAEADLERKLGMLRHEVTARVHNAVDTVERPMRWLRRNRWYLLGGSLGVIAAMIVARHYARVR